MDLTLRPMSASQVLDRTFSLYRQNFLLFAGITALPPALLMIGQFLLLLMMNPMAQGGVFGGSSADFAKIGVVVVGYFSLLVLLLLGYAFASGATVYAVSRLHLGHPTTIGETYRLILPNFGNILGIFILVGIIVFAVAAVGGLGMVIPMGLAFAGGAGGRSFTPLVAVGIIVGVLVFIVAIIFAIYLSTKLSLSVPVCVLERLGVIDSIKRSWNLTTGTVWRIILINFLAVVISVLLSWVLSIPYFVGIALLVSRKQTAMFMPLVMWQYVAEFLARTLAGPVATIAVALIYYDQRVRREAFDLQLMMQSIGPPPIQSYGAAAPGPQ
jgi:hypothetical protein